MANPYPLSLIQSRLTRRRLLAGTGALSAAALIAAACGGGDDDDGAEIPQGAVADKNVVPGGTVSLSIGSDPANFDFQTQFVWHQTAYMNRLLRYKTGGDLSPNYYEVIPDLATGWEQQGGDTLTVKLNPKAKFHNKGLAASRVLDSGDVKTSLELLASNKPQYVYRYLTDFIERIDTPDAQTVTFKLQYPTGLIFNTLAYFQSAIAPKEYPVRDGNLSAVDVGTGPFILEKYEKSVGWTFKKNPEYFVQGLPYLDGIDMPFIADANATLDAFRVGKIDTASPSLALVDSLAQTLDKSAYRLQQEPGVGWAGIWPNVSKPPFNDIRVRQAVSLALDRNQINQLGYQGKAAVRVGPVSRGWAQWSRPQAEVEKEAVRDVARAKQLLTAAGHEKGFDIDYTFWGSDTKVTEIIQQQLKDIGINIKINNYDLLSWQDKLTKHDFTLAVWSMRAYADPDDYLYPLFYPGGSKNYGVVDDPKLTALVLKQRQAATNEERKQVLLEIERRWFNEFLYGIYHVEGLYNHVSSSRLVNYSGRNPPDHAVWAEVSIKQG